ncbi:hypothetical protein [Chryseobacterium aquifrigidense]|uniref:hypothetical protein n=1 Tax=Chryseobacterium aquifrigidense TaxID=558021 RepID=UPI001153C6AE|nr:hypothetical protein [Chryseobacterium aquifrigidense]
MEELEQKVLEAVRVQHIKTGGNNGLSFIEIDKILNMEITERNGFIDRMVKAGKIRIGTPLNARTVFLPK